MSVNWRKLLDDFFIMFIIFFVLSSSTLGYEAAKKNSKNIKFFIIGIIAIMAIYSIVHVLYYYYFIKANNNNQIIHNSIYTLDKEVYNKQQLSNNVIIPIGLYIISAVFIFILVVILGNYCSKKIVLIILLISIIFSFIEIFILYKNNEIYENYEDTIKKKYTYLFLGVIVVFFVVLFIVHFTINKNSNNTNVEQIGGGELSLGKIAIAGAASSPGIIGSFKTISDDIQDKGRPTCADPEE